MMGFLSRWTKGNRTLLAQLAFTALAFIMMAVLSYGFMGRTVRASLVRVAESVLDFAEVRIVDSLSEFEFTLEGFAETTRDMLLRGNSKYALREYIEEISGYTFLDGKKKSGIQNFFGYFENSPGPPIFIHSSHWDPPEGYRPEDQRWYRLPGP